MYADATILSSMKIYEAKINFFQYILHSYGYTKQGTIILTIKEDKGMTTTYKPKGYSSVTPYIIVAEAEQFIAFIQHSFDAVELERHTRPDGTIQHAACRIGDAIIEIGGGTNKDFPPMKCALHLYVEDADEVYNRALKAGARSLYEPQNHDYGERSGGVEDPFGNHWYIATSISR